MTISDLPALHATINTAVAVILVVALVKVRSGDREAHKKLMLGALLLSCMFLISYVVYHLLHGSTRFQGTGVWRPIYFTILISHTVLAIVNLPGVVLSVVRAWQGDFERHRRVAKWTWYVWFYVAVTGPIVYLMLYVLFPGAAEASDPKTEYMHARRLHQNGDEQAALELYRKLIPSNPAAECFAEVLGTRLRSESSQVNLDVLERHPNNVVCSVLRAREWLYDGENDRALERLEPLSKKYPDEELVWSSLAFAQFRKLMYREAAESFEKTITFDPKNAVNVYNAGYAHFLYGNYKKSIPLLEKALAMGLGGELKERAHHDLDIMKGGIWVCPMHPSEEGKAGALCSLCGMKLEVAPHGLPDDPSGG